jgi:type IV pilus assembly protein PilM
MPALQTLSVETEGRLENGSEPKVGRSWVPRPWALRKELLGLDVGSSQIKAILLSRKHGNVSLKQAAVCPTPQGVVTAGELTDAISVANSLRKLCKDYRVAARRVAVAVSGEKVYTQLEVLPSGFEGDLEGFLQDAMMKVIPYPVDRAAFDYETFPEEHSPNKGVFWVSSNSEQVEWLREAVTLAGKVPAVVDVQACALANAYSFNYQPQPRSAVVLLHIGPRQMTIAQVRGSLLLCSRDASLSRDRLPSSADALAQVVVREVDRRWDLMLQRAAPAKPERIYVSGGLAHSAVLREALSQGTGLPVEELNPFREISYSPATEAGQIAREHGATLAVAVGLALRSFEEL